MNNEIYARMAKVSKLIGFIAKNAENRQQGFKFRRIDDIYNGVHSAMAEAEVICIPKILRYIKETEITTAKGGKGYHLILEMEFIFYAPDGSNVVAITWGEAIDYGDKTINKCMSIAHKYALIQCFTIPTEDTEDPDETSPIVENTAQEVKEESPADKIATYFLGHGISESMLETFLKKPMDYINQKDIDKLKILAERIKKGENFKTILAENSSKNVVSEIISH